MAKSENKTEEKEVKVIKEEVKEVKNTKEREKIDKVAGVIAEYNPFHAGHLWQLKEIKGRGASYVVVAMSGDFVQRGEPALVSKYERTRMALLAGADLVVELPLTSAAASAPYFASGGVHLLSSLGVVDELYFGSESTDEKALLSLAEALGNEEGPFQEKLSALLKEGKTFPAAREEALLSLGGEEAWSLILRSPNDILALEYILAIRRQGSSMIPRPLPRKGSGHHGEVLAEEKEKKKVTEKKETEKKEKEKRGEKRKKREKNS